MLDVSGQVALVTGGASGIGRETARCLAELGAEVVLADCNKKGADQVAREIAGGASALQMDVTDASSVRAAVADCLKAKGRIDVLVHSAGVGAELDFLTMEEADWRRILDVDLTGTFLVCQAVARAMVERRYGRIVVLSSAAGLRGGTGRAAYGAAKAGMIGLVKVMAVELSRYGITANALAPGAIETELVKRMHDAETRSAYRRVIPQSRYGDVGEVAAAAAFLASREASYITGSVLAVDGGFLAAGVMKEPA